MLAGGSESDDDEVYALQGEQQDGEGEDAVEPTSLWLCSFGWWNLFRHFFNSLDSRWGHISWIIQIVNFKPEVEFMGYQNDDNL